LFQVTAGCGRSGIRRTILGKHIIMVQRPGNSELVYHAKIKVATLLFDGFNVEHGTVMLGVGPAVVAGLCPAQHLDANKEVDVEVSRLPNAGGQGTDEVGLLGVAPFLGVVPDVKDAGSVVGQLAEG